jgi:hypothetical protein
LGGPSSTLGSGLTRPVTDAKIEIYTVRARARARVNTAPHEADCCEENCIHQFVLVFFFFFLIYIIVL